MVNPLISSSGSYSYYDRGSTVLLVDCGSALGKLLVFFRGGGEGGRGKGEGGRGKGELECAKVVVERERLSNFLERSKLRMAATVEKYRTLAARSPSQ